jgi:hypothetical protein
MDLKNAVAVCLISLFSATLVVLIARSLDSQAAARLEPQLISIAEELRALRKQGGISPAAGAGSQAEAADNGLLVYYFHGNTRCPTCRSIESQAEETVQTHFVSQLSSGEMAWKILNYEQPAAKPLATKFGIEMPVVVLARMKDGQVKDWKRLDKVWALVGDKPAFGKYVREEIDRMLPPEKKPMPPASPGKAPAIPIPSSGASAKDPPPIPVPGE